MIRFRHMLSADIPAGLALCRSAGWNQLEDDWKLFLARNPKGCIVSLEEDNALTGTAATLSYTNFSWIGMVLVDPQHRRKGIGMALLKKCMEILQGSNSIRLDATDAGRELYLQLGFRDEYPLVRMLLDTGRRNQPGEGVRNMVSGDMNAVQAWDRRVFSGDRAFLLEWLHNVSPSLSYVLEDRSGLKAYCFGRRGFHSMHIGPLVAVDEKSAFEALLGVLRGIRAGKVTIDIDPQSHPWQDALSGLGFKPQRTFTRMCLGAPQMRASEQFAIAGPEFG